MDGPGKYLAFISRKYLAFEVGKVGFIMYAGDPSTNRKQGSNIFFLSPMIEINIPLAVSIICFYLSYKTSVVCVILNK